MEIIAQNDKFIDEIKKHLLLFSYHGKKGDYVTKYLKKKKRKLKNLLPEAVTTQIKFTSGKFSLCFNIRDETKFEHKPAICHGKCPEDDCPNDYIGKTKRIAEGIKDHKDPWAQEYKQNKSYCYR